MKILTDKLQEARKRTDEAFLKSFPDLILEENEVYEAAKYSFIGGGKALRPFLVFTISDLLGLDLKCATQVALAVESVHAYSLIHDDLPAMDNDTLRRGKPTCHIQFSEATAILTGDALLTKAFEVLSDEKTHPDAIIRCQLISLLSKCAGINGMIGGQLIDLKGETKELSSQEIYLMQKLKTGALLKFSCIAPAVAANKSPDIINKLEKYAQLIGILFQITDDILDAVGDEKIVGKTLQKDKNANKSNFVTLFGKDNALEKAKLIHDEAISLLKDTPLLSKNNLLETLTNFILVREY
ncbi:MAG: polyprenyl synthetase family protein [Alphaproteobacteria bacterium]|nr:polyprenyl synthetase family protein [Alphaproteobacteria bacterium]